MPTIAEPYTQDSEVQRRIEEAKRSAVSDNPEAVKQALTQQTFNNDTQLNEAVQGQQDATNKIMQLAEYDQQLAGEVRAGNQQQQQVQQQQQQQATQLGAFNPNDAQATIAAGPVSFDTNQIMQTQTPTLLSPFVASGIASGATQAGVDTFQLADFARGARERYLGNEVSQLANLYQAQYEAEQERRRQEEANKLRLFELDLKYAQDMGGEVVDPLSGKVYKFPSPQEKAAQEAQLAQAQQNSVGDQLKQIKGRSGKSLFEEVVDGQGNFMDVIRENPGLSQEQVYELARINTQAYGAFKESPDQLRSMGLSPEIMDQLGIPRAGQAGTGSTSDAIALAQLVASGQMKLESVPADMRGAVANEMAKNPQVQKPQISPEVQKANDEVVSLANEILSMDTKSITGNMRLGLLNPFDSNAKTANAKLDQLKGKLALAMREKLRGQGTITDKETDMIEKAVAALDPRQSDEAFRAELDRIIQTFSGNSGGTVTMIAPDGRSYAVAPEEVAEAQANGWRAQ